MSNIGDALTWVSKQAGNLATAGLVASAAGSLLLVKLEQNWQMNDLLTMGCGGGILFVGGGYAVVRGGRVVQQELSRRGFTFEEILQRVWPVKPETRFDWLTAVTETYRPGRRKLALPVGVDNGQFVEVSMEGPESHLLVSGITGTGKSVMVNQLIIAAAMSGRYQVVIAAMSGKDYQVVANAMKNVHLITYAENMDTQAAMQKFAEELPHIMGSFNQEVTRRQQLLSRHGVRELGQIRADQRPSEILLLIEEFANGVESIGQFQGNKARAQFLGQVMTAVQFARASGMHLGLLMQRPTSQIPNNVKKQMAYVTMRVADAEEAYWSTNRKKSGAESLRVVDADRGIEGEALVIGSLSGMQKVSVPLTADLVLEQAAKWHEADTLFAGEPTWAHGYKPKRRVVEARAERPLQVSMAVPTVPTQPVPRGVYPAVSGTATSGNTPPLVPVSTPAKLPLEWVLKFADRVYATHPDFKDLNVAYTRERTLLVFTGLWMGLKSENEVMMFAFRNRGRYRDYVKLCGRHYCRLVRGFEQRYGVVQARAA